MSAKSRPQYVFIEVKKSSARPCVTLLGPSDMVNNIVKSLKLDKPSQDSFSFGFEPSVRYQTRSLGSTTELRLTGPKDADSTMFWKASLLEEALRISFGFRLLSNVTDDCIVLSREVTWC